MGQLAFDTTTWSTQNWLLEDGLQVQPQEFYKLNAGPTIED